MSSEDDIVWHDQQERVSRFVKEAFPDLETAAIFKILQDWMFCSNQLSEEQFVRHCFAQALEMYDGFLGGRYADGSRPPEAFAEFIRPLIELFFEGKTLGTADILALIHELSDPDAQR